MSRAACRNASSLVLFILGSFASSFSAADYDRIEEDDPSVTYTGNWQVYNGDRLSGGRLVAGGAGATATVTFTGTGIAWYEYFSSQVRGGANVYLDGVLLHTVQPRDCCVIDVYGENQYRYDISGLADTTHVVTFESIGARNFSNALITIDYFVVERGGVTRLIEESDPAITYTGTWTEIDDPSVSGGSVLASREPGATATVRYRGNAISWISYACPCAAGIARVGGGLHSAYDTDRVPQATVYNNGYAVFSENLWDMELTLEVTGDSAAQSPWVVVDAFRVQTGSSDGADTTPPEIVIRSPDDGEVVRGRVPLIADTFDNEQVAWPVRWYVDGTEIYVDSTRPVTRLNSMFWWVTLGPNSSGIESPPVSSGWHEMVAVARDSAGNETRSAPVTVYLDNTIIKLTTSPSSPVTGTVTLSAGITGDIDSRGVRFYAVGGDNVRTLLGEDTTAPYSITRDTSKVPSGRSFQLWAEAYGLRGNSLSSEPIGVVVQH